jgi:hypothetical protein
MMKRNDETEVAYMVRMLRDGFDLAAKEEANATIRREAALDALMLAERTAAYLEKLAKQAESK